MPSFNQAQFIDASIASVLNQSYRLLELIVADGGSTDGTQAALARWQAVDARVRWISEPDQGPADAVNKALALARGTYVGWLNSDDLYTAGALVRALEKLTGAHAIRRSGAHGYPFAESACSPACPTHAPTARRLNLAAIAWLHLRDQQLFTHKVQPNDFGRLAFVKVAMHCVLHR